MSHLINLRNLLGKENEIEERMSSLFQLRQIVENSNDKTILREILDGIREAIKIPSILLRHELAYVMGQMKRCEVIPILIDEILRNKSLENDYISRHEACEALGALGPNRCTEAKKRFNIDVMEILKFHRDSDKYVEVRETCELAVKRIEFYNGQSDEINDFNDSFDCIDPAPSLTKNSDKSLDDFNVDELKKSLKVSDLFQRYRVLFTLRDLFLKNKTDRKILEIIASEAKYGQSALYRHECAFVLGQIALFDHDTSNHLNEVMNDLSENSMVRHECIEAMGAFNDKHSTNLVKLLYAQEKTKDDQIVWESCRVALNM
ncbi:hypothetical protein SNEBB_003205 [Seison nebaliae]|nr:hypothetical protein SNEBB_003205 [Seison nebaliae]